ncbi:peptidoglycan-binding protein [Streptomyces indicus]|uniref:HlyD family secretion protein n=1 Tax=Streptomyces indicus TaxID=417292 RepID=A0A1G8WLX4_9ACTN|nr:peptidoglycan-binding protein [Streptomyces indicus]SDJ79043.1 HlyD family secretion protein [Streptomyces indicus]
MGEPAVEDRTRPEGEPEPGPEEKAQPQETTGTHATKGAQEAAGPHEDTGFAPETRRPRGRRGFKVAVALAVLATGGAVTAAALGLGGADPRAQTGDALPPATAEVTRGTLADTETADGQLGHGTTRTASTRLPGTLTWAPGTGDRITRGKSLYAVDGAPVTLMYGSTPAYRALKEGVEGADVRQLEKNLDALGYEGFTVDEEYTAGTADAVRAWQEDRGLAETGEVPLGQVVFADGAVRVDSVQAQEGDALRPGDAVLAYTGTSRAVTVELDSADQEMAKEGAKVEVRLPDDQVAAGKVEEVTTVIKPAEGQQEAETKIEVVVGFTDDKGRKAAEQYALAAVHVDFTARTREDVLTVPVAALLALAEGGFGVEVVEGTKSSYVPVETGLFANGRVEVSGAGIAEGVKVGVPK